jgi:tRNA pseudouridine38-40 synthase
VSIEYTTIAMVIEYDGSTFCGWQYQASLEEALLPGIRSVQGALRNTLGVIFSGRRVWGIESAGRTDSGVHARGQVVVFKVDECLAANFGSRECNRLCLSVSSLLRGQLSVLRAGVVRNDFHPRYGVTEKQYSYKILNRPTPPVLDRGRVWHVAKPIDVDLIKRESQSLIGRHDFSAFRSVGCANRSVVKEITEIEFIASDDLLVMTIRGTGFLRHMVRIIIGTLVDRALGRLDLSLAEIRDSKDRSNGGVTAPPQGLSLDHVIYDEPGLSWLTRSLILGLLALPQLFCLFTHAKMYFIT